jgi:uncharacterized protein YbbC (DUF1343 family)
MVRRDEVSKIIRRLKSFQHRRINIMRLPHPFCVVASLFVFALSSCVVPDAQVVQQGQGYSGPLMLGSDVLASHNFDILRGKRVGLITNHTSYTARGEMTRVMLKRALGPGLTTLFAPEHGIFGTESAGVRVKDRRDSVTGLPVYSLHGDYRKPQPWMLANIDMLVFDVQDIGCRSYTYISTMAVSMEAAAENGKSFVVLDRPNPLGGQRVEGPPLSSAWKSFVGQIPVPYVHGMTTGELAMMISGQHWISHVPKLTVIKMQGWNRSMIWTDTGLRWHQTSPNIPNSSSPAYYVATGILGGASNADVGIPWSGNPFSYAGAYGVNPQAMYVYCSKLNTPGVSFSPYSHAGFGGVQININPRGATDITALDVRMTAYLNRLSGGNVIAKLHGDELNLFNKVYGSDTLYRALKSGGSVDGLIGSWQSYNQSFRGSRQRYLLYP